MPGQISCGCGRAASQLAAVLNSATLPNWVRSPETIVRSKPPCRRISAAPSTAATFSPPREPLDPVAFPDWREHVNRDRVYDFYAKEARFFRALCPVPLPERRRSYSNSWRRSIRFGIRSQITLGRRNGSSGF